MPYALPRAVTMWKKGILKNKLTPEGSRIPVLIELRVPKGAYINLDPVMYPRAKNRVSQAKVVSIRSMKTRKLVKSVATGPIYHSLDYRVGKTVIPDRYSMLSLTCAPGVHCFKSRQAAKEY